MLIQKIHRYFANSYTIVPLCLLILFVTTSARAHPAASYSGEDLFRGIYFAQGPVANQIAVIKSFDVNRFVKDADKLREISNFQSQVMTAMKRDHSDFLQELKASVDSKNNYKIKATLLKGNELLLNVSSSLSGSERDLEKEARFKTELEKRVDLSKASGEEISAAVEEMASSNVVIDIWILTPVCLIAFCWVVVYIGTVEMQPQGLFQEQLVSAIAKL